MATEQVDDNFSSLDLNRIAIHLREIGIPVRAATLGDDDQLPGVRIAAMWAAPRRSTRPPHTFDR